MLNVFSHCTLQSLYEAARMVLDEGKSPELLRDSVEELETMVAFRESSLGQEVLDRARDCYARISENIEIDIDDGTMIDHNGTDGHWVMAWCFVQDNDSEEDISGDTSESPGAADEVHYAVASEAIPKSPS